MEKPGGRGEIAADFEEAECRDSCFRDGGFRDFKAEADMGLACEVIEFVRFDLCEDAAQGGLVVQVRIMKGEGFTLFPEVLDAVAVELAGSADEAVDFVSLFKEKLGEVGSILSGDAGYECFLQNCRIPNWNGWVVRNGGVAESPSVGGTMS